MSQYFEVHPDNPQPRLLRQAAQLLQAGGVCAVPTDSSYALVCRLDDKAAAENMRRIRQVDDKHHLTLICRDTQTPYSGMLPAYIAGHYTHEQVHIDLRTLAQAAGARFFKAQVTGLDRSARR